MSPTCYGERRLKEESLRIQKQQAEDLRRFNQESLAAQRSANNKQSIPQSFHRDYSDQPRTASPLIEFPNIGHKKIRAITWIVGAVAGMMLFGYHGWETTPHLWGRLFLIVAVGFAVGGIVGYVLGALLEYALPWILGGAAIIAFIAGISFLWGENPPNSKPKTPSTPLSLNGVTNESVIKEITPEAFSEADKQLNILYKEAMQRLSPEEKVKLRNAQREWLKALEMAATQNPEKSLVIKFRMTVERSRELENFK